ncbi:MAG: 2-phospho-L-lactate guanylyltransferase [Halanaeroarchaeum sp.]
MRVVIPFDATTPKSRLSTILDGDERASFAREMLRDVIESVTAADLSPTVVSTEPVDVDVPVTVDDRRLTPLINDVIAEGVPVAVVMADLANVTPAAVRRLVRADGDVVIAPGRGGGTNALVVRDEDFSVDYHGVSFRDHRTNAAAIGADLTVIDSFRLATDVDERSDLVEVLLHGTGDAADWLRAAGVRIEVDGDRPSVER